MKNRTVGTLVKGVCAVLILLGSVAAGVVGVSSAAGAATGVFYVVATPVPNTAGQPSTYTITFTTSSSGALAANSGTITITAPTGTVLPLAAADYSVNGTPVTAAPTQSNSGNVTFVTPVAIGNSAAVTVVAGIGNTMLNPAAGTFKFLYVNTSTDTTQVFATPYTIAAGTITQSSSTTDSVTVLNSSTYSSQITTTGNRGAVTYSAGTSTPAGVTVSTSGAIATTGTLGIGNYSVSGTTSDAYGNTGTYTFTLSVTAGTIDQTSPTSDSVVTTGSAGYTGTITTSGGVGPVTFSTGTSSPAGVNVSSSGDITTTGPLAVGTYPVSGTTSDTHGDAGTYTFTLSVTAGTIDQTSPTSDSVPTTGSASYTGAITTSGNIGTVTYSAGTSSPAGVNVDTSGNITTTAVLAAGSYVVSGTTSDGYGNTGTYSFTLVVTPVTIVQGDPTSGTVDTTDSAGFTDQLATYSGSIGTVTYSAGTSTPAGVNVDTTGAVSTSGTLAATSYLVTGTTSDAYGDTGTYSYTLVVTPVTIDQSSPTTDSVTTTDSADYTGTITTTGNIGPATFSAGSSTPAGVDVDTSGNITTTGTLAANDYAVSGTTSDAYGDTGTYTFTLTVNPVTIDQSSPTSDSVPTTGSAAYTGAITTTGGIGTVTFSAGSSTPAGVNVDTGGNITTTGPLAADTYLVTGTTSDAFGDTGTYSFTLSVTAGPIDQTSATSDTVATTGSSGYTGTITTSGNIGPVTFTAGTSSPAGVDVDTSGNITTTGTLAAGSYVVSGTTSDAYGNTGTYSFTLVVTPVTIDQTAPTSGAVTTTDSSAFTDQLTTSGGIGTVTFTAGSSSPAGVDVDSTGAVTTTGALASGSYTVSGTTSDAYGDAGTYSYTLVVSPVTIVQGDPTSGTVATTGSSTFTDQLTSSSGGIGTVTYSAGTSSPDGVDVDTTGAVTTTGALAAGSYLVTGTTSDAYGDTGTYSYTLVVTPVTIVQGDPTSGTVATTGSSAFTDQLTSSSGSVGAVTYSAGASTPAGVNVDTTGAVTTTGNLAAGSYLVTGTTSDAYGDTGTYSYTLVVTPVTIDQTAPTSGTVTTTDSPTFTDQLATSGGIGTVTYSAGTSTPAGVDVSTSGAVTTTSYLGANSYVVSGTTSDAYGDTGTYSYTLVVTPVTIVQVAPTTGSTTTTTSTFSDQLATTGSDGNGVTFVTTVTSPVVTVSSSGAVSANGYLNHGTYVVSGTDHDGSGNSGTWSFTLNVAQGTTTVAVTSSANPTPAFQSVTYTATVSVTPPASGTATGTVDFKDGGTTISGCGAVSLTNGVASCTTSYLGGPQTTHPITAVYGGNAHLTGSTSPVLNVVVSSSIDEGYWLASANGGVFTFGGAKFYGSAGSLALNKPIVNMAVTPDGKGYWLVASDGGIFSFGDAGFYGSTGSLHLNKPIVGMTSTPDGKGYWLVASDGGIFAFGDAGFYGSTGSLTLNKPVVGMAAAPGGKGYWLVASDGGIFAFGDAGFHGSTGSLALNQPVVGMASTHDGNGYWLVASDGGVFSFGDATFYGSAGGLHLFKPVVGMVATPSGNGYWFVASDGGVFAFGDAYFVGSIGGVNQPSPIVGLGTL